jgi:hypothetical protein
VSFDEIKAGTLKEVSMADEGKKGVGYAKL